MTGSVAQHGWKLLLTSANFFGLKALEGAQGPKHEILGSLTFLISADKTRLHIISKSGKLKCSPRWQTWVVSSLSFLKQGKSDQIRQHEQFHLGNELVEVC